VKPSVYIETSIVSYLTARPSRDLVVAANQEMTARWWRTAPDLYDLYISQLVRAEVGRGDEDAANRRLALLSEIQELKNLPEAMNLAARFIQIGALPPNAREDASHLALASVHGIDFFLTWNCRHINNATKKPLMRRICEEDGYRCPEICTPYELLGEEVQL